MVTKLLIATIALLLSTPLFSQSILEKATAKYRDNDFCKLELNIYMGNIHNQSEVQKATLELYGDKYILELNDQRIFSDGQNTYTYSRGANELIIEKIDILSPLQSPRSLLAIDSKLFDVTNTTQKGIKTVLTLKSNKDISGVNRIDVTIKDHELANIMVIDNGDNTIEIEILDAQFNKKTNLDRFKFHKKDYKGVEIIDFR